jgi:hypothetical protein
MNSKQDTFSIARDHEDLPELAITQEQLDTLDREVFGDGFSPAAVMQSEFLDLKKNFYRQRIVRVRSNETLLVRFRYDYEIDLDKIDTEADLLIWLRHLCGKNWMTIERLRYVMDAIAAIKGFDLHKLPAFTGTH